MRPYKVVSTNNTFSKALEALKEKKWIKVPEWDGYWFLQGGKIKVMTWDNQVLDTPWYDNNVLREDWQIIEQDMDKFMESFRNQGSVLI